jgi:hypothetical protein
MGCCRKVCLFAGLILTLALAASPAWAQGASSNASGNGSARNVSAPAPDTPPPPAQVEQGIIAAVTRTLFLLFALAVVLESALAILFNWRPFVETFNSRAVKPVVSLAVSYFFISKFSLDLVTALVNAATSASTPVSPEGLLLTSMVVAGGSAAVNNMLVSLGVRQARTPETVTPKPPKDKAWIAVRLNRKAAVGGVGVFIGAGTVGKPGTPADPATNTPAVAAVPAVLPPVAGIIGGTSTPALRYILSDRGRFPGFGGHAVAPNTETLVVLQGRDQAGALLEVSWGPFKLADGAIVDLDLSL